MATFSINVLMFSINAPVFSMNVPTFSINALMFSMNAPTMAAIVPTHWESRWERSAENVTAWADIQHFAIYPP